MQRATPKHQALTADMGQVAASIGSLPIVVPAIVAAEIVRFVVDSCSALNQAERALVNDQESAGKAADLLKSITAAISAQEAARKIHTAPLDAFKAKLMKFYGVATANLEQARTLVKDKAITYARAEQERLEIEAADRARAAALETERLAQAQAALGDTDGAEQIREEAAARPSEVAKVSATGAYGATLGLRTQKRGTVTNNRAFLKFLVAFMDSEPTYGKFVDDLRFPQSAMNDLARAVLDPDLETAVAQPDGFLAESESLISTR